MAAAVLLRKKLRDDFRLWWISHPVLRDVLGIIVVVVIDHLEPNHVAVTNETVHYSRSVLAVAERTQQARLLPIQPPLHRSATGAEVCSLWANPRSIPITRLLTTTARPAPWVVGLVDEVLPRFNVIITMSHYFLFHPSQATPTTITRPQSRKMIQMITIGMITGMNTAHHDQAITPATLSAMKMTSRIIIHGNPTDTCMLLLAICQILIINNINRTMTLAASQKHAAAECAHFNADRITTGKAVLELPIIH